MVGPGTGGNTGTGGAGNAGGSSGGGTGGGTVGCPGANLGVASHANEGAAHIVECSPTNYGTVPPSSGTHYPVWPAYKTYGSPVPWGFLVHGLEHGAVVVVYNCPQGCGSEVAAAQAWINALPVEGALSLCPGTAPRVILAPDPTLDVRWAASAWTWTLRACSFDQALFQQFFDDHYNHASEEICRSTADPDRSATGWCP